MQDLGAARTYAQALFAEAQMRSQLPACQKGLEGAARTLQSQPKLAEVLMHPMVTPSQKRELLVSILGEHATPVLEQFLQLLIVRHRFDLLPLIAQSFGEAFDRLQQIEAVTVRSAFALSEAQRDQLKLRLQEVLKSKIRMDVVVDPQLIGGFVAQTKDYILDQSIKGQLDDLRKQLVS